jgi:hypothetical protein
MLHPRLECTFALVLAALLPVPAYHPAARAADEGYTPLFNGKDLAGWVNVNCHPDTFYVKDGEIITTGKPTGFLRTEKQYENFVLEMDWMHVNKKEVGNSGLFVWGDPLPAVGTGYTRGIEVQVLVNLEYRDKKTNAITATSHGDLFSIWGAKCVPDRPHPLAWERCLPSENRAKGGGEWNHYKVTANNGAIKLEVNGKEVSGVSQCNPRKGYLALESEDAECHFKNIRIKELPSTNPKPEECAKVAEGHVTLFDGLDLKGWKTEKDAWKAGGGVLKCVGNNPLTLTKSLGPGELIFDYRATAKSKGEMEVEIGGLKFMCSRGEQGKTGPWRRIVATIGDGMLMARNLGIDSPNQRPWKIKTPATLQFSPAEELEIMNVFFREPKEKK